MKKILITLISIILAFSFNIQNLQSKLIKFPGLWSLYVGGNLNTNFGVSASMNGTMESVESFYRSYGDYTKFPFGDKSTSTFNLFLSLSYRFPESNFSLFLSSGQTIFNVDNNLRTLFGRPIADKWADLRISTLTPGVEYTLGNTEDLLNAFGKLGIGFNIIGGDVRYYDDYFDIHPEFRLGIFSEIGGRFNVPHTPVSLDVSASYTNANLIGKARDTHFPSISEIDLNDGASDSDPAITSKTIDYLSLNFGISIWF